MDTSRASSLLRLGRRIKSLLTSSVVPAALAYHYIEHRTSNIEPSNICNVVCSQPPELAEPRRYRR